MGHKEAYLRWRNETSADPITIRSPLSKYLELQRRSSPGGAWKVELGRIVARDYAILARFSDTRDRKSMVSGLLQDYFLFGIRGLGTWGAAWFLDRKYRTLQEIMLGHDDEPIQRLLEITYVNENIHDVRDVSQEPKSYFDAQNQQPTIRRLITYYHPDP